MKLKSSAIALAVAGTVATPMAAQADLYASARIGVENVDTAGVSDLRMRSFGSRFGVRSEADLGNGMTGFGRYEWDVDFCDHANEDGCGAAGSFQSPTASDNTGKNDDIDIRHRYVGLKGDFGSLTIGQTYHTFYNYVVGPADNPWWASGYAMVNYRGRTDNAVTYAGGTGNISFGATGYFVWDTEEEAPDQMEFGASFGIGDMTLGVGLQSSEVAHGSEGTDDDIVGLLLSGIALGDASIAVGYQMQDEDTSILLDVGLGNIRIHFETLADDSADSDPTLAMVGYTQSLGRKTTAWYELVSYDADSGDSDDDISILRAVLKYDIE